MSRTKADEARRMEEILKEQSERRTLRPAPQPAPQQGPPPNDYSDEVTDEQLDAMRNLVDPGGSRAQHRRMMCEPGW
jgi:hypothetical protein